MRKYVATAALLLLGINLSGCASFKTMAQAQEMNQKAEANLIRSYDRIGDAYHILAYEYYKLAADAEKRKLPASQIDEYKTRMTLYDTFYRQTKKAADDLRMPVQNPVAEELPTISPNAAPAQVPSRGQNPAPRSSVAPSAVR